MRFLVIVLALCAPCLAGAQSVALTFDDGFDPREESEAGAWNQALLKALADAGIKSIMFAAGGRVDSPAGMALLRQWGEAGQAVGNHTYTHPDFADKHETLHMFIAEVQRDQSLLQGVPGWQRRLRFPYLKEGDSAAKRDGMREWLTANQYQSGAVSIDTSDWYYDQRYTQWRVSHPTADGAAYRAAYLRHLWDRALYYDGLSRRVLGRSVLHVILLHARRINADFLPDIIAMFRAQGWSIIAPQQAFADPVYAMQPRVLPAGESILWSLAKQAGLAGLRYPAEDDVYEKPILDGLQRR